MPIVASNSLATMMARKGQGGIDGFVIEGPTAGGHNAPPRGEAQFNERGEPIYGARDEVDLEKIRGLGLPFWLAGGTGSPDGLRAARKAGAAGIQVGTLFAFCDESGLTAKLKASVLEHVNQGKVDIITDPLASPTGYPFKIVHWDADPRMGKRERVCDLGYLRSAHRMPDGKIVYRCASEPVEGFMSKGGAEADTTGRQCLCNALMANIGLAQERGRGVVEPPLLTSGDELGRLNTFLRGRTHYTADEVIDYLMQGSVP
jgi:nitronate monooxygenase